MMFCPYCGKQINQGAQFCPYCGNRLPAEIAAEVQNLSTQEVNPQAVVPQPVPFQRVAPQQIPSQQVPPRSKTAAPYNERLSVLIGKNQPYYLAEFAKVQSGGKSKFNWSAFLLNAAMCFYRRSSQLYKKYFLLPQCLLLLVLALMTVATIQFNFTLMAVCGVLSLAVTVFMIVNLIRFGLNFNREYYAICLSRMEPSSEKEISGVSVKSMVLYWVIVAAVIIVLDVVYSAISVALIFNSF